MTLRPATNTYQKTAVTTVDGDMEMTAIGKSTDGGAEGNSSGSETMSSEHGADMQKAFLCYFGILGLVCLSILYGSLIGIVVGTNSGLQTSIKEDLNIQMKQQAYATLDEAGDYLTRVLNGYDQSVCNMTSGSMSTLLRVDYDAPNAAVTTLYWDNQRGADGLAPTVITNNTRFPDEPISLEATAGYIMGKNLNEITAIFDPTSCSDSECVKMRSQLGGSAHLDALMKHQWNNNEEIVQMFLGFATNPPSLRRYPGRPVTYPSGSNSNQNTDPVSEVDDTEVYDPTVRDWYRDAEASMPHTVFTAPYPDFHGLGWMITGAKAVYQYADQHDTLSSSNPPTPIGVVGIDILITDIANVLNSIKFLKNGKLALFTGSSGQVVTDEEWDSSIQDSVYETRDPDNQGFFYTDLKNPVVSSSTWEDIKNTGVGAQKEIIIETEDSDGEAIRELIFVKRLSDYEGQYYLVVFVDETEIIAPVQPAIDEMTRANKVTTLLLLCTLVGSMVLLMLLMLIIIKQIVHVFNDMQENVEMLLKNVGTGRGLSEGMMEIHDSAATELEDLQSNMNTMIQGLQNARNNNTASTLRPGQTSAKGQAQGKEQLRDLWNIVPMMDEIDGTAPPIAHEYAIPTIPEATIVNAVPADNQHQHQGPPPAY